MTTTVTEQEKREALARWEGWGTRPLVGGTSGWYHPDIPGHRVTPPDYWNDGNAMLRLLAKAVIEKGCWFKARGVLEQPWEFVLVQPSKDDIGVLGESLPAAIAEAVWRALTVEELSR